MWHIPSNWPTQHCNPPKEDSIFQKSSHNNHQNGNLVLVKNSCLYQCLLLDKKVEGWRSGDQIFKPSLGVTIGTSDLSSRNLLFGWQSTSKPRSHAPKSDSSRNLASIDKKNQLPTRMKPLKLINRERNKSIYQARENMDYGVMMSHEILNSN